jgi:Domain of unknown function (DUF5753)
MPGIFQTEAYIRRMLTFWYTFLNAPDDATVTMKAERTAIALNSTKRIAVVLGEQALHTRRGTPAEHADQFTHLLSLMRLPFVSVGVIPAAAQRHAIATIGFWIFDNNAVALETPQQRSRWPSAGNRALRGHVQSIYKTRRSMATPRAS